MEESTNIMINHISYTDNDGFYRTLRIVVTFASAPADGEEVPIYWQAEAL